MTASISPWMSAELLDFVTLPRSSSRPNWHHMRNVSQTSTKLTENCGTKPAN